MDASTNNNHKAPHEPKAQNLHCLRGLAALSVTISHLGLWHALAHPGYHNPQLLSFGVHAVPVFFVISGFIIAYAHQKDIGHGRKLAPYAIKRALRIYPPYLILSIIAVLRARTMLQSVDPSPEMHRTSIETLSALLLIPLTPQQCGYLAVSWSLYYGVLFYLVFSVFFMSKRAGWVC